MTLIVIICQAQPAPKPEFAPEAESVRVPRRAKTRLSHDGKRVRFAGVTSQLEPGIDEQVEKDVVSQVSFNHNTLDVAAMCSICSAAGSGAMALARYDVLGVPLINSMKCERCVKILEALPKPFSTSLWTLARIAEAKAEMMQLEEVCICM